MRVIVTTPKPGYQVSYRPLPAGGARTVVGVSPQVLDLPGNSFEITVVGWQGDISLPFTNVISWDGSSYQSDNISVQMENGDPVLYFPMVGTAPNPPVGVAQTSSAVSKTLPNKSNSSAPSKTLIIFGALGSAVLIIVGFLFFRRT